MKKLTCALSAAALLSLGLIGNAFAAPVSITFTNADHQDSMRIIDAATQQPLLDGDIEPGAVKSLQVDSDGVYYVQAQTKESGGQYWQVCTISKPTSQSRWNNALPWAPGGSTSYPCNTSMLGTYK